MSRIAVLLVLLLLAGCATLSQPANPICYPLATHGADIVDSSGKSVRLKSVNWFGAESAEFVVGGLDKQPLERIVRLVHDGGFNSVRLPWSNELVERNPPVDSRLVAANPELRGLSAMEVVANIEHGLAARRQGEVLDDLALLAMRFANGA